MECESDRKGVGATGVVDQSVWGKTLKTHIKGSVAECCNTLRSTASSTANVRLVNRIYDCVRFILYMCTRVCALH